MARDTCNFAQPFSSTTSGLLQCPRGEKKAKDIEAHNPNPVVQKLFLHKLGEVCVRVRWGPPRGIRMRMESMLRVWKLSRDTECKEKCRETSHHIDMRSYIKLASSVLAQYARYGSYITDTNSFSHLPLRFHFRFTIWGLLTLRGCHCMQPKLCNMVGELLQVGQRQEDPSEMNGGHVETV